MGWAASAMDMFPGLRQGSCKRGSGALPPAGTLQWLPGTLCASVQKKILPLRLQPATRWVSAAHHLLLPAVREAEAGERQTGDPEAAGYSPSRRVPGAWPRCGWAALESGTRPGQPRRAEMQDSGAVPAPRGHAQPLLWLFLAGGEARQRVAPRPPGRTCRAQHPFCGSPRRRRVSRQGAPASVTCR